MFIPHPFFLAAPTDYKLKRGYFARTRGGDLIADGHIVHEYRHKNCLEWILDFDGIHVENVDVEETFGPLFACKFNCIVWGYNYPAWTKCISDGGCTINFTLSLRIHGFLIDAWEFTDAVLVDIQGINGNQEVFLCVTTDTTVSHVERLARVDLGLIIECLKNEYMEGNPPFLRGKMAPGCPIFDLKIPIDMDIDVKRITPRQFLVNFLKQQQL